MGDAAVAGLTGPGPAQAGWLALGRLALGRLALGLGVLGDLARFVRVPVERGSLDSEQQVPEVLAHPPDGGRAAALALHRSRADENNVACAVRPGG